MTNFYDIEKIKFATDPSTFMRAVELYEGSKVTEFKVMMDGFTAVVRGGHSYRVFVSARHYDRGNCECYLGQHDTLCKHMVALALWVVARGQPLRPEDKEVLQGPQSSGHVGVLTDVECAAVKKSITAALRYIKPYSGPSRTWFVYQDSLSEGCRRLLALVTALPVNPQTTKLLVDLLLRLDTKLCHGGVDDSDGTVGGFIQEVVQVLQEYVKLDPSCKEAFQALKGKETCFGWEEPLVQILPR